MVVEALGSNSKNMKNCIEELVVVISTALLQKANVIGTAPILRFQKADKLCENGERGEKNMWGKG